jgi:glycosyl transferase, family 25
MVRGERAGLDAAEAIHVMTGNAVPGDGRTSALESFFDAIYIINLPSRGDRRAEIAEQLARIGSRIDEGRVHLHSASRPESAGAFPTIGAHGCFLSHLSVLKRAEAEGRRRILILEDDVDFAPDFVASAGALLSDAEVADCSILYLGFLQARPPIASNASGWTRLDKDTAIVGAHMISFDRRALLLAVPYLETMLQRPAGHPLGGPMHVDGAYNWFRRSHDEVRTMLCVPPLGLQRPSRTDIHPLKWYDRSPLTRRLVSTLRKLR